MAVAYQLDPSLSLIGVTPFQPAQSNSDSIGSFVDSSLGNTGISNSAQKLESEVGTTPVQQPGSSNASQSSGIFSQLTSLVGNIASIFPGVQGFNAVSGAAGGPVISGPTPTSNPTTVNTANPGGITGLFTAFEDWAAGGAVRVGVVVLGIVLIGGAIVVLNKDKIVKVAKIAAS